MDRALWIFVFLIMTVSGCARIHGPKQINYRTVEERPHGDSVTARKKHQRALKWMNACHYVKAEQCLQEALIADVSFGPAHNSLGKLYFDQKKFYLAAWEFEHAMKTMPGRSEPVNNLGLVFESVGQLDKAIANYQQAVEMAPTNAQYLGNLLRARIQRGDRTSDLRGQLDQLIFLDERTDWVDWAKGQLVLGKIDEPFISTEIVYPEHEYEIVEPATEISQPKVYNFQSEELIAPGYDTPPADDALPADDAPPVDAIPPKDDAPKVVPMVSPSLLAPK